MDEKIIKKFVTRSGISYERGDFYGVGTDEVIIDITEEDSQIVLSTSLSLYHLSPSPGDYITYEDGSYRTIKSKHDIEHE